jgi:hypothetical protein
MELYALIFLSLGLLIGAISWFWLVVRAFQTRLWWGLPSLFVPPVALWFALRNAQKSIEPLVIFALGSLMTAVPLFYLLLEVVGVDVRALSDQVPKLWSITSLGLQSDAAHEWMERSGNSFQLVGISIVILAWLWLVTRAARMDWRWGLSSLVVPPVGLAFAGRHPRKGIIPAFFVLTGLFVAALPAIYTRFIPFDLGQREKQVNGQMHLTLTGWDRKSYSILAYKPEAVVLQMANPDVNDETLDYVKGMKDLQELDLNETGITDKGLAVLEGLPVLERLRVARTRITDQGFRDRLAGKESLMMLDVRGTEIKSETTKAWRDAKPGRRVMQ